MQSALMIMAAGPGHLLGCRTGAIVPIWVIFDLADRGSVETLVMAMVISPGHKFSGSLLLTIKHVAGAGVLVESHVASLNSHDHSVATATEKPVHCSRFGQNVAFRLHGNSTPAQQKECISHSPAHDPLE